MVSEVMQTYHFYLIQKRKMIYSLVTANEIHMLGEILMYRNIFFHCYTQAVVQVINDSIVTEVAC